MNEFNRKTMQLAAKWAESYAAQFGTHCPADNDPAVARAALQAHLEAAYQAARRSALEESIRECEEIADHWDAMRNTQASMAADQCVTALRALAGEGMKD